MDSSNSNGLCGRVCYANGLDLCLIFSITPDGVVLLMFIVFLLRFTVVFTSPTTREGSSLGNDMDLTKKGHAQSLICVAECLLLTHILQFHVSRSKFILQTRKKQERLMLKEINKTDRPGLLMKIETTKRDCFFFNYIGQQMFPVQATPNYDI